MKYTDRELEDILNKLIASTRSPRGRFSAASSYPQLEKKLNFRNRRLYLTRTFAAAAAVVLLCLSVWTAYLYMQPATIQTVSTLAETRTVHLPDGTSVTLNHYSSLSYPERFKSDNREVELSGEAYFEVAKDKDKPFIVKTKEQSIEALGTKFNVSAYPTDSLLTTTLLEGSVLLTTQNLLHPTVLKPNEQFVYNKRTRSALLQQVDANRFVSWTTGYYYFPEQSLEAILYRLSHVYGVQFTVKSEALNRRTFTGTFYRGQSIKDIMEIIHLSIPVRYKIDDHHVTISEI